MDLTGLPSHARASHGIARTFQNVRLCGQLTVWQNLWVAQNAPSHREGESFLRRWFGGSRRGNEDIDRTLELCDLTHKRDELASNLAFGEQRRLELARAAAGKPALILLDEPAAGMNAEEIDQLDDRIRRLRAGGMTILLIEHHMELVMAVTDRIAVLNFGRKIAEGTPSEVQADPAVREPISAPPRPRRAPMLQISNLVTAYGKIEALKGVSLSAEVGRVTCLLGPNGAGKTTLMMSVAGILQPRRGSVRFDGQELVGLSPVRIVAKGIALVPENRLVFPQMSVRENLLAGAYSRSDKGEIAADIDRMYARFPRLRERSEQVAGTLSGGEQQMLAVARALMSRPRLLLMDEPSLGLAPLVVAEIFRIVAELNNEGTSIFLVEQNAHMALTVASHFYLMQQGRVTFSGDSGELSADEVVQRAYLGGKADA